MARVFSTASKNLRFREPGVLPTPSRNPRSDGPGVLKARTLEEALDSGPEECVVEPQYEVELVELKEKKRAQKKPTLPSAAKVPTLE